MPIYAYKCSCCQHELDVLQKISDLPLRICPRCGAASFTKQLTAAGFQLKGSGWYVTDFKNAPASDAKPAVKPEPAKSADGSAAPTKETAPPKDAPAKTTSATASGGAASGS